MDDRDHMRISIHAPHEGERQAGSGNLLRCRGISIHAPHEGERRYGVYCVSDERIPISIHAPHEGERHLVARAISDYKAFQSTLPTRGSDPRALSEGHIFCISIHAPHEGERRQAVPWAKRHNPISIHAPHEGERLCASSCHFSYYLDFNPRSPRGGATCKCRNSFKSSNISIHAPHEGERLKTFSVGVAAGDFNPRSPRGGATLFKASVFSSKYISIHAPHEGERPQAGDMRPRRKNISIHAPHEGERP